MENYQIIPDLVGFQVVEFMPDGRHSAVSGFPTVVDARQWLDSFLVLLGLISFMSAGRSTRFGPDGL
jgi:hypothetical protein